MTSREQRRYESMGNVTCEPTGKRCFGSRAEARKARNNMPGGLSIYLCPHAEFREHFHLGHHGGSTREQLRRRS